jgi:hypothetical protein
LAKIAKEERILKNEHRRTNNEQAGTRIKDPPSLKLRRIRKIITFAENKNAG